MIIPLYIQETHRRDETIVVVRPLFAPEPERSAELLSRAMTRFSHDLRKSIEAHVKSDRHDSLLRYSFAPETETVEFDETLTLRRQRLHCRFLLVCFRALGRRIAFSPSIPEVWFDINKGEDLRLRPIDAFTHHFREVEREGDAGAIPPPAPGYIRGWINTINFDVSLYKAPEKPPANKFAALFEPPKMDGRDELEKIGRRLESLYPDDLERAVLRDAELEELSARLRHPERRAILLVGPRQSGKTALIHERVFRKLQADPRPHRQREDTWLVSPQRLISGMMYAGQWESRLLAILNYVRERDNTLYFDDLLGLFLAGVSASSDLNVAQVLRPYIERREIRVLGEISPEGLRALRERDHGFADLFEILRVEEPSEESSRRILISVVRSLEGRHGCTFDLDVLPTLSDLQRRYARDQALPGKVAGILRRLAAKFANRRVTREILLEEYHRRTGISLGLLDRRRKLPRRDVLDALASRVEGQPEALAAMTDAVGIAKAQLNETTRPLSTFLFLGPTGVGKTHSAKALAAYLFGSPDRLLRLDMNEYVDPYSASRLIGTWRHPEGILTSAIRQQPFAVVLLDEIEKAHGEVHDLLLQLLGEGRLTDSLGRTADFSNAVIIMTSNLGVREAQAAFGFSTPGRKAAAHAAEYRHAAERFFRPEFFNRIDRVVPFSRLSRAHTAGIARRLIDEVFSRDGLQQRRAILCVEDSAIERIVDQGYLPHFGARALKRTVEDQLTRPVAAQLSAIAPGTPTLVNVFPAAGDTGIAVELCPLQYASPASLPTFADPAAVLDAVDAAMDRLDQTLAALQPKGRVSVDSVSSAVARYFAMREQQTRIDRFLEKLTRAESRGEILAVKTRITIRGGRKRSVLAAVPRRGFSDVFAADDIHQYLASIVETAQPFGATGPDRLRQLISELALLESMAAGAPVRLLLAIREMVPRSIAVAFMTHFYQSGLGAKKVADKKYPAIDGWAFLTVDGAESAALAAAESGIHLIGAPKGALLPMQVFAAPLDPAANPATAALAFIRNFAAQRAALAAANQPAVPGQVLRVYDETILDLRSSLAIPINPTPDDLREVLLARLTYSPEIQALPPGNRGTS